MVFMGLTEIQKEELELDVASHEARKKFTRLIRSYCKGDEISPSIIHMNRFINIANSVLGNPIYRLESDDSGEYHPAEYAWHSGTLELIMHQPTTTELAEILADFIENEILGLNMVNDILERDNSSFRFNNLKGELVVEVDKLSEIPDEKLTGDHPNIRKLVERMDGAIKAKDPANVLHTAASIIETLAKDVLADVKLEDQSLRSFFDKYRKASELPEPLLEYMESIFKARNTTPLAGHGSTKPPDITMKQAVTVAEMTKAMVRIERDLVIIETNAKHEIMSVKPCL